MSIKGNTGNISFLKMGPSRQSTERRNIKCYITNGTNIPVTATYVRAASIAAGRCESLVPLRHGFWSTMKTAGPHHFPVFQFAADALRRDEEVQSECETTFVGVGGCDRTDSEILLCFPGRPSR